MKVGELIKELKMHDPNAEARICTSKLKKGTLKTDNQTVDSCSIDWDGSVVIGSNILLHLPDLEEIE